MKLVALALLFTATLAQDTGIQNGGTIVSDLDGALHYTQEEEYVFDGVVNTDGQFDPGPQYDGNDPGVEDRAPLPPPLVIDTALLLANIKTRPECQRTSIAESMGLVHLGGAGARRRQDCRGGRQRNLRGATKQQDVIEGEGAQA
jgi:hypothetical protein